MATDNFDKDFYKILGVSKDADQGTIKKTYRKLAKDLHPDTNPGDKATEERFKDVSEAYDVLSDAKRRKEYDEMRTMMASGGNPFGGRGGGRGNAGGQGFGGQNINLEDLFGGGGGAGDIFGGLFGNRGASRPRRGADLETKVLISFEESLNGTTVSMKVNDRTISARIPAGVNNDSRIRLKGKGGAGEPGATAGDLFVDVHVAPHPVFSREGNNLTVTIPVTFAEAGLGADIKVPVLGDAPVTIRIPAGTKSGAKFRTRGKGVKHGDTQGDLIVSVEVVSPKEVSADAKAALEAYALATADFSPRDELMRKAGVITQNAQAGE